MAAGSAKTPDPAISPAKTIEATPIPRPFLATFSITNFSGGAPPALTARNEWAL